MNKTNLLGGIVLILILGGFIWYAGAQYYNGAASQQPAAPAQQQAQKAVPILHPFGTVTAKTATELTLKSVGDSTLVVKVTADTKFLSGTAARSLADISVGSMLSISSSTPNTDGSLTASSIQILPPLPPIKK